MYREHVRTEAQESGGGRGWLSRRRIKEELESCCLLGYLHEIMLARLSCEMLRFCGIIIHVKEMDTDIYLIATCYMGSRAVLVASRMIIRVARGGFCMISSNSLHNFFICWYLTFSEIQIVFSTQEVNNRRQKPSHYTYAELMIMCVPNGESHRDQWEHAFSAAVVFCIDTKTVRSYLIEYHILLKRRRIDHEYSLLLEQILNWEVDFTATIYSR